MLLDGELGWVSASVLLKAPHAMLSTPCITFCTDGAVIDCYPSDNHNITKKQFLHNAKTMRELHARQLDEKNELMAKYLGEQKSSYPNEQLAKDYKESRRM